MIDSSYFSSQKFWHLNLELSGKMDFEQIPYNQAQF